MNSKGKSDSESAISIFKNMTEEMKNLNSNSLDNEMKEKKEPMKFQDFVEKHKTNEPTPHTLFKNATKEIQNKSGNSSVIKRKIDQISTDENQNENEDETENVKKIQ